MRPRVDDPSGNYIADWNFVADTNEILTVEGGNSFCSSHYDPERVDGQGIGEVRQLFYPKSSVAMPPFLTGRRHCGTDEQWSIGYAGTPSVTYKGGYPTCCFDAVFGPFSPAGGLSLGGRLNPPTIRLARPAGGLSLGGSSRPPALHLPRPAGGLSLGGLGLGPITVSAWFPAADSSSALVGMALDLGAWFTVADSGGAFVGLLLAEGEWTAVADSSTVLVGGATFTAAWSPLGDSFFSAVGPDIEYGTWSAAAGSSTALVGEQATSSATLVQVWQGHNSGTADMSGVTWPGATTAGNLLVALIGIQPNTTITAPAGWLLAKTENPSPSLGRIALYYYANAPSHSGGEAFVPTSSVPAWAIILAEYAGVKTVSPLDKTASNFDLIGSTNPDSGTTATTIQATELQLAGVLYNTGGIVNSWSNSFSDITGPEPISAGTTMCLASRNTAATGAADGTATIASSAQWIGVIGTFKLK